MELYQLYGVIRYHAEHCELYAQEGSNQVAENSPIVMYPNILRLQGTLQEILAACRAGVINQPCISNRGEKIKRYTMNIHQHAPSLFHPN